MTAAPFVLTDTQRALGDATRSFFAAQCPESRVRSAMAESPCYDAPLWRRVADELGLSGLLVPESAGGSGAGYVEIAIAFEAAGRCLLPVPLLATTTAVIALRECASESGAELLAQIAAGASATVAWAEPTGRWELDAVECRATGRSGSYRLTGQKSYVVDGVIADVVLVLARGESGIGLYAVPSDAAGLQRSTLPTFDRTRALAMLELNDTPATMLSEPNAVSDLERTRDFISTVLAAEHLGVAQQTFDLALGYARERVQFGRVIGSFQAIKHLCADLMVGVESARSAAYYAAWAATTEAPDLATVSSLARAYCADVAFETAGQNMQIHGGISFTWEHPAHLYYRRAKSSLELFGSPTVHRERVASQLGLTA